MSASIQVLTRAIQLLEILPRKDAPMWGRLRKRKIKHAKPVAEAVAA